MKTWAEHEVEQAAIWAAIDEDMQRRGVKPVTAGPQQARLLRVELVRRRYDPYVYEEEPS